MRTKINLIIALFFLSFSLVSGCFAVGLSEQSKSAGGAFLSTGSQDQKIMSGVVDFGNASGTATNTSLPQIIANVIKFILALLGVIMLVIVIYSGVLWMTAGGNVESVEKAKKYLKNALIGLILILAAYAIAEFAVVNIANIVTNNGGGGSYLPDDPGSVAA
ncbi:MAG: pilin [Patescibacteria group bacterium]